MSEQPGGYLLDDITPPHADVLDWVDKLTPVVGDIAPPSVIASVVGELFWRIGHELRGGRDVGLVVGRLVCDGEVVEWLPSE